MHDVYRTFKESDMQNGYVLWNDPKFSFINGIGNVITVQILLKCKSFTKTRYDALTEEKKIICNIGLTTRNIYIMNQSMSTTYSNSADNDIVIDVRIYENGNIGWSKGYVRNDFGWMDDWIAFYAVIRI